MTQRKKNILVISDNPQLVKFFQNECMQQKVNEIADIKYKYTSVNKIPSLMIELGAEHINIKSPKTVANLVDLYDLIFSLHCKQIFPSDLVSAIICINVHPGFNPYNRGWYPQVFSIINEKIIGATIHIMDKEVDHGEIIDQIRVEIKSSDTSKEVYERVIESEKMLISKNLLKIIKNEFTTTPAISDGNYNSIEDFKSKCNLNLDDISTLGEHIKLLRALTHGSFKNAFYLNKHGKKVYIRVTLEEEYDDDRA
jgi:methionyl-tRNA formyltransferase